MHKDALLWYCFKWWRKNERRIKNRGKEGEMIHQRGDVFFILHCFHAKTNSWISITHRDLIFINQENQVVHTTISILHSSTGVVLHRNIPTKLSTLLKPVKRVFNVKLVKTKLHWNSASTIYPFEELSPTVHTVDTKEQRSGSMNSPLHFPTCFPPPCGEFPLFTFSTEKL